MSWAAGRPETPCVEAEGPLTGSSPITLIPSSWCARQNQTAHPRYGRRHDTPDNGGARTPPYAGRLAAAIGCSLPRSGRGDRRHPRADVRGTRRGRGPGGKRSARPWARSRRPDRAVVSQLTRVCAACVRRGPQRGGACPDQLHAGRRRGWLHRASFLERRPDRSGRSRGRSRAGDRTRGSTEVFACADRARQRTRWLGAVRATANPSRAVGAGGRDSHGRPGPGALHLRHGVPTKGSRAGTQRTDRPVHELHRRRRDGVV